MLFRATRQAILDGLDQAIADYKVAALTRQGEKTLYEYIRNSAEIVWDYLPTVLPPKKFFFPQHEVLLEYDDEGAVSPVIESEPFVLFGVRPCDLHGIQILDEAFGEDHGDPNYLSKREAALLIGMDCHKLCDKDAFCYCVNAQNIENGFDLMLHELDDQNCLISVGTDKGAAFLKKYFQVESATSDELEVFKKRKAQGFEGKEPFPELDQLPEKFEASRYHPIWEQEGSRCFSCGSCVMVCPTCYCFDVKDEWNLDLKKGQRERHWDGCMADAFATVATGENFRDTPTKRLHHRINRKFNFLMSKYGQSVCVGCGRCVRACLVNISPKTIAEAILGESDGA